jgi:hypothetical protein
MEDIERCRTEDLGGQVYYCANCRNHRYSYHSCKNRHCPKCQNDQANEWLEKQDNLLLPVTHFMVTFTLPEELRSVARANQKIVYNILFRASSEALQQLALDPRFIQASESLGARGVESKPAETETGEQKLTAVACCPNCGTVLTLIRELKPGSGLPPWVILIVRSTTHFSAGAGFNLRRQERSAPGQRSFFKNLSLTALTGTVAPVN